MREAVIARTGKAPGGPFPPASSGSYPFSPTRQAIKLGLVAAAVAAAIVLAKVLLRSRGPQDAGAMMSGWTIFMLACLGLGGLIALNVRASRGYRRGWKSSPTAPTSSLPGPSGMASMPANPAPGTGYPSTGAAAPAVSEARATCYFNTPARMRDCFPCTTARIFTCKGELELDGENQIGRAHV